MWTSVEHRFVDEDGEDLKEPFTICQFIDYMEDGTQYGLAVAITGLYDQVPSEVYGTALRAMRLYEENHDDEEG